MAMAATDLKNLFTIKIKAREDNICDQYNRIFMMKIMLVCSVICGISWYGDKFNCIVPESMSTFEDFPKFVGSTCWIQGVYIYRELRTRKDDVAYYGVTTDIDLDGRLKAKKEELCKTVNKLTHERNEECEPMAKTFFLQYQYMPFLVAAIGLLFYLPYMVHKVANHDLIKLGRAIKKDKPNFDEIFKAFFKKRTVKPRDSKFTIRHLLILLVKVGYLAVNIVSFRCFDSVLNGLFYGFGNKWWEWTKQNNTMMYDYMGSREFPKPANELLPPFGYCELHSGAKDIKETHTNKHLMICELSQHILYQYVLMLIWLLLVIGIVVSVIGLVYTIVKMIIGIAGLRKLGERPESRRFFNFLTHREMDYLEFLKVQNVAVYGEMKTRLFTDSYNPNSKDDVDQPDSSPLAYDAPMYFKK